MDSDKLQIIDPKTTYIDEEAEIGQGTVIYPNTTILGKTKIGKDCEIGPNVIIQDSEIADGCVVFASVVKNSKMEKGSDIGPFSHLRGDVEIGQNVHIGNYVEMVRTKVGSNTKVGHVTYLGDATVGENVNIGAGTITANYDGKSKNKTVIEDGVFIGADTTLVAPVKVGKGAKTGAGAVVIENVSENTLVVGVPAVEKKKI
ncbi:MAG TPA: DapH/DapD/GlmU-related protein [Patescibacteria group bacterium]|nr:DapH/DapD/GlmU-related protein [Patescibacteria group bacterium]